MKVFSARTYRGPMGREVGRWKGERGERNAHRNLNAPYRPQYSGEVYVTKGLLYRLSKVLTLRFSGAKGCKNCTCNKGEWNGSLSSVPFHK